MGAVFTDIQKYVELSIFHALRLQAVEDGYLPDITDEVLFPRTNVGYAAYLAAITNISTTKGFAVEIFNNSNPEEKNSKKTPRIVIITEEISPGEVGSPNYNYSNANAGYHDKLRLPDATVDISFRIHVLAGNAQEYTYLSNLLFGVLPIRNYIPLYDVVNATFLLELGASYPAMEFGESLIERVYRYVARDLYMTEPVSTNVVHSLIEINMYYNMASRGVQSWFQLQS